MKLPSTAFLAFALLLLLNLNVCRVESARPQGLGTGHHAPGEGHHPPGEGHHHDHDHDGDGGHKGGHKHDHKHHHHDEEYDGYSFYVFGDSFADNGNLPSKNDQWPELTRQWHEPYSANGRFSNNQMVQSDFIANMLGQSESPPAHMVTSHVGQTGMNFAAGGAGVFEVQQGVTTLGEQVHAFHKLVKAKKIKKEHLEGNSVALVAISGNDYARVGVRTSGFFDITAFVDKVTTEIQTVVARLQEIGVDKVIVNNLFPVGCAPSQTRPNNHTTCEEQGNQGASLHNKYLGDKLADKEDVLVLDISAAFTEIIGHHGDGRGELAHKFGHKLTPCCESVDPKGYCGQRAYDEYNEIYSTYSVCDEPNGYFFWDDMNPTQAGWAAVMGQLESPIKEFLDLD